MTSSEPKVRQIRKLLVANRGEIAVRIIRTASRMGIDTIAIVTNSDHDTFATETEFIDEENPSSVFLNPYALINIAKKHHADAIHPGYGYLSENGEFARLVEEAGLIFIGPSSHSIVSMGNKNTARKIAINLNIPVAKATNGSIANIMENSHKLPYPLLVKASAGGGGKGMLPVYHSGELEEKLLQTSREALSYFGDGTVFVEQFIDEPRHIEIQVLGDKFGNLIHLFERECSIQRRYQKIIEESPSPFVNESLRKKLTDDSLKICKAINYYNAGTIEFLVDKNGNHFFLEMNTRIQVEHPVTEMVTGIDIVEQQLLIAMGLPLRFNQTDVVINGHAIECRIYAEDTENDFTPSPGQIQKVQWPDKNLARTDTWFNKPVEISTDYDPMVAKIITHAPTRSEAIVKAVAALNSTCLTGLITNINFLRSILFDSDFINGLTNTSYFHHHKILPVHAPSIEVLASTYLVWLLNYKPTGKNIWQQTGYWRMTNQTSAIIMDKKVFLKWQSLKSNRDIILQMNNQEVEISNTRYSPDKISITVDGKDYTFNFCMTSEKAIVIEYLNKPIFITPGYLIDRANRHASKVDKAISNSGYWLQAPIPGKIAGVLVSEGDIVKKGDRLITLEAMKMENHLTATEDGIIESVLSKIGQQVKAREVLLTVRRILVEESSS